MRRTDTKALFPSPGDGERVESAFPAFRWWMPAKPEGQRARLEVRDASGRVVICAETTRNFYITRQPLAEGSYDWNVTTPDGERGWWRLTIVPGADSCRVPDARTLLEALPGQRPRHLWLPADRKTLLAEKHREVELLRRNVRLALRQGMPPRPRYRETGRACEAVYRKEFQRHRKYVDRNLTAAALAAYLLEDEEAGAFAKSVLLELAAWGTDGLCAVDRNVFDEIGLSHVRTFFGCYDWLYPLFSPEEHRFLRSRLSAYARQMKLYLERIDFPNLPGASHASRLPAYLGVAGLVLGGLEPEAQEWLQEALDLHAAVLPHYGDRAGGWAEGPFYAASYCQWPLPFFAAIEQLCGYSFLQRREYRNMAHFFLHLGQPDWEVHPFGDGYWCKWNDREWRGFFAQDPFQPFADRFGPEEARQLSQKCRRKMRWFEMHLESAFLPVPRGKSKADRCEQSRYFPEAGFVSIHTDIASPERDHALLLRASRHGTGSHQHADQGSFSIISRCQGMITPSGGFNPPEGGSHHAGWTQQTLAHNCLLIGGRGQPPRSAQAVATIRLFEDDGRDALVRLDLGNAYGSQLSYERTALFIRPGIIVIADWVTLSEAEEVEWRVHTGSGLKLCRGGFEIRRSSSTLKGRLFQGAAHAEATLTISNSHTPDGRQQQHLGARFSPCTRQVIFALLELDGMAADVLEASVDQLVFRVSGREYRLSQKGGMKDCLGEGAHQ